MCFSIHFSKLFEISTTHWTSADKVYKPPNINNPKKEGDHGK